MQIFGGLLLWLLLLLNHLKETFACFSGISTAHWCTEASWLTTRRASTIVNASQFCEEGCQEKCLSAVPQLVL